MDLLRNNCWLSYERPLFTRRLLVFETIPILHFLAPICFQQIESKSLSRQSFKRDKNCMRRFSQLLHQIRGRSIENLNESGDQRSCVSLKDRQHGLM
jgi:hypothetical protein